MAIYDFSISSFYEVTGVDSALLYRAKLLSENDNDVKVIFIDMPFPHDFGTYKNMGLDLNHILCVQTSFSDIKSIKPTINVEDKINEISNIIKHTSIKYSSNSIVFYDDNLRVLELLLDDDGHLYSITYYKNNIPFRTDMYSDVLYCSLIYKNIDERIKYFGNVGNIIYYNRDGSIALEQTNINKRPYYFMPDGQVYNRDQLFEMFVDNLHLTKNDIVILDRPISQFSIKPIIKYHGKTNIVAIMHSEHYLTEGYSYTGLYLNREYWSWFRYSKYIDVIVVGTEEQKEVLAKDLDDMGYYVPRIEAIPAFGLDKIRYHRGERKRKSIICVTRFVGAKKTEWAILAAIKAHEVDKDITMAVYGTGTLDSINEIKKIIADNNADDYIKLKGFADVKEVYKDYEVFLSASLKETFGITLLEAIGSGLALIGFDVRYGNRLFIKNNINGYLVDYNPKHMFENSPSEVDELAKKIIELTSDGRKVKEFSSASYDIAKQFMSNEVSEKWNSLVTSFQKVK